MARRVKYKTLQELDDSSTRIYNGTDDMMKAYLRNGGSKNDERYKQLEKRRDKAVETFVKYSNRITRTKKYKDAWYGAANERKEKGFGYGDQARAGVQAAKQVKISQRTYMGKVGG